MFVRYQDYFIPGENTMNTKKMIRLGALITLSLLSTVTHSQISHKPYTYSENFESGELAAWASYPLWQDTAYDDNFRVNTIVPGDPNISIEQMVTPYSHVDTYAGAQKKLVMILNSESTISMRYYLKTHLSADCRKIRIAGVVDGGEAETFDYTVPNPLSNRWERITLSYSELLASNPSLSGHSSLSMNGIAVLIKVSDADPTMPLFFGLDDIVIKGARTADFKFSEPRMHKLSEWQPYIPDKHYRSGESFTLSGEWSVNTDRVTFSLAPFPVDAHDSVLKQALVPGTLESLVTKDLKKIRNEWTLNGFKLLYDPGLYIGSVHAFNENSTCIAGTVFTLYIAPPSPKGKHPRLWFDRTQRNNMIENLKTDRFKAVHDQLQSRSKDWRTRQPLDKMAYDFDQFPEEDWLISRYAWSRDRIRSVGEAVKWNALAYSLLGDVEAGSYAKEVLKKYAAYPTWLNPWMKKRGRHFYLLIGDLAMDLAIGYDCTYDLFNGQERELIRKGFMRNVIQAAHKGYVEANLITSNTSNWIAAIIGGTIMCQAALYYDEPETETMEPYFTGAVLKEHAFINNAVGGDGGYGEGYGYYHYSSRSWASSLTSLDNVFGIDLSEKLRGVYEELAWAGIIEDKKVFYFGDSRGALQPMDAWAWLLEKHRDPLLGWMYTTLHQGEPTLMDIMYDIDNVPVKNPYDKNPVRLFRDIGTTVFKSGWERDDFIFVLRTGPFYNHQHLDQGSFWLADRGKIFIGERQGSAYYDDPFFESHYTQPIAHSTILIDNNKQSQRTGDPRAFIDGFNDHAFIHHVLDGDLAAFTSGDIGKLYWGKVKDLKRNVLYLKPRTLLMLDTVVPAERDVDVTLLYQTDYLKNISAGEQSSMIRQDDAALIVRHLSPDNARIESREMPHFLREYDRKPLERNGYLTVTARTDGVPLVIGNILSTEHHGALNIESTQGNGFVAGHVEVTPFAFSTQPDLLYETGPLTTDALALTWTDDSVFAALCRRLIRDNELLIESEEPITCEIKGDSMKYYLANDSFVAFGVSERPETLFVNGESKTFMYEPERKVAVFSLKAGEGTVRFE